VIIALSAPNFCFPATRSISVTRRVDPHSILTSNTQFILISVNEQADASMPVEIADSDDGSEILIDQLNGKSDTPAKIAQLDGVVPSLSPSKVDFSGFFDPTQRLSELSSSGNLLLVQDTGSTEKILRDLEHGRRNLASSSPHLDMEASNSRPTKRGQSDVGSASLFGEDTSARKKRSKTYNTKSRTFNTQSSELFADIHLPDEANGVSENVPTEDVQTLTSPSNLQQHDPPRERDRPRRVISLLNAIPDAQISTSTSSMGGYQSYNLDFRGSGQGLDINTNPFGSVSQVSVEEGLDSHELAAQDSLVDAEQMLEFAAAEPVMPPEDIQQEMMTSPERPAEPTVALGSVGPSMLLLDPMQDSPLQSEPPSKRRKTDLASSRATASPGPLLPQRAVSVSAESISNVSDGRQPKKRARKPKNSKLTESSPAPEPEATSHHGMDPPAPPNRKRKDVPEAFPQASEISESNTKRNRKKSRAEAPQESSPVKEPSSELNISDEQFVGLPKEHYKPRPSRSRSKRSEDPNVPAEEPAQEGQENGKPAEQAIEDPTPKSTTRAKNKKAKVKRAKTSAFALKKSEAMLSDGDEDMIYMDEKPATIKLDLPPDVLNVKKEETKPSIEEDDEGDIIKPAARKTKTISIEIPAVRPESKKQEQEEDKPEPKKRGRKPNKRTPSAPTPEPFTDDEAGSPSKVDIAASQSQSQSACTALKDKDPNTPVPKSSTKPTTKPSNDKENQTSITASPAKETPKPSPKQPTHSPLKSTSSIRSLNAHRVGLSKRHSIPSLLRRVDKTKKAPTKVSTTVKERKVKAGEEDEGDEDGRLRLGLRGKDGELIEWEF
jgi:hypothetical protein